MAPSTKKYLDIYLLVVGYGFFFFNFNFEKSYAKGY